MTPSLLKNLLLVLLSVMLPLQAAMAASQGGCLRHSPGQQDGAGIVGLAGHGPQAPGSLMDDAPCPHHQAAEAPAASPEPGCNGCDWCFMGAAMPSPSLHWPAGLEQAAPAPQRAWAYVSPHLGTLERPPRALLSDA